MKIKPNTDLTKYGFKQWANGIWYLECKTEETQSDVDELSIIVENNELKLYHNYELDFAATSEYYSFNAVYDLPLVLVKMIKDRVIVYKNTYLTKEQKKELVKEYHSGVNKKELIEKYNICRKTFYNILKGEKDENNR